MLSEDNSSVQVSQSQTQVVSSTTKFPIHTPKDQNSTPPTQIVEPVLGGSCQPRSEGLRLN